MLTTRELRQAPGSQSADRSDGIRADADRPSGGPNPLGCHPQPIRTDPPGALGMREKSAMWVRWWWERRSCTIISGNLNVTWGCFGLRSAWRERLETYQAPPSNFRFQSTPMHPQEPPQAQAYCGKQLDEPPSDSPPPSAPQALLQAQAYAESNWMSPQVTVLPKVLPSTLQAHCQAQAYAASNWTSSPVPSLHLNLDCVPNPDVHHCSSSGAFFIKFICKTINKYEVD